MALKKETALDNFFTAYAGIEGTLERMDRAELDEFLEDDIFVDVASATTGIPEQDFKDYAPIYFKL
jgi:hypothetical protein